MLVMNFTKESMEESRDNSDDKQIVIYGAQGDSPFSPIEDQKLLKEVGSQKVTSLERPHQETSIDIQEIEPYEGMKFESLEEAESYYEAYAKVCGFSVRKNKRRTSSRGLTVSRELCCSKEGKRRENEKPKERVVPITREDCQAMIRINLKDRKWVLVKVIKEHSHRLTSPTKTLRLEKNLNFAKQCLIETCTNANVSTKDIMTIISEQAGGIKSVGFRDKDGQHYSGTIQQSTLKEDNAQVLVTYLKLMQLKNPSFYYSIQTDEEGRMLNYFWADVKSKYDYESFGDVVHFDTAYKTNCYNIPFATFIGVNHHKQPVLLGCAWLCDETERSFLWLFNTWIEAMNGRHPISIITDHDKAIMYAIAEVFKGTRHCFGFWYIKKKIKDKLPQVYIRKGFKDDFRRCVDSYFVDEFEKFWKSCIDKYDLCDNIWLLELYDIRENWVPAYFRNTFFAGMVSSQRKKSICSFFDGMVDPTTTLQEFVIHYSKALDSQCDKEKFADYQTMHTKPLLKVGSPIEIQALECYTKEIFAEFQEELVESNLCVAQKEKKDGDTKWFSVSRYGEESQNYTVVFNHLDATATCTCQLFEFLGILCKHVLVVYRMRNVPVLPSRYILKRWSRNPRSGSVTDGNAVRDMDGIGPSYLLRYSYLCHQAIKLAELGAVSVDSFSLTLKGIENVIVAASNANSPEAVERKPTERDIMYVRSDKKDDVLTDPSNCAMREKSLVDVRMQTSGKAQRALRRCNDCKGTGHDRRNCPSLK